jgi:ketosteroid isomerase-like protein
LEVAASGDLAVRTGVFDNTYTDPATRQPARDAGRYIVIYRKTHNSWRAALDIETSQSP